MTDQEFLERFAARLNRRMRERHINGVELAKRIGASSAAVYAWRRAERTISLVSLNRIAIELDCSVDWLIGLSDVAERGDYYG